MLAYTLRRGDAPSIERVEFEVLSAEDIRAQSVVEVTETSLYTRSVPTTNGLNDLRMGTVDRRFLCSHCGETVRKCPGHLGHINLPWPCYHIQFVDTVVKTLRCVCFFCSRANLSAAEARAMASLPNKHRFTQAHLTCKLRRKCQHCGAVQPTYARTPTGVRCDWPSTGAGAFADDEEAAYCARPLTARIAQSILSCIPAEDRAAMGFATSHPKDFVLDALAVAPPVARPTVMASEGSRSRGQDDMTLKLGDILRRCVEVRSAMQASRVELTCRLDEDVALGPDVEDKLQKLQLEVYSFMNSNVKAPKGYASRSSSTCKSVSERLRGKEGRIRANLMGKRVNQSARCVISPDVTLDCDEVGVPRSIALQLTVPERVHPGNLSTLTHRVRAGPNRIDGADSVITSNGTVISLEYCAARSGIQLQVGWIVQRYLNDGDPVIFNRQPSLHKMGMMGHRAKIVDQSTFRLNLSVTGAYNADFDGDEMNLHVPQSPASLFECQTIMSVPAQNISCAQNKPCIAIVQDALVGMYLLTRDGTALTRSEAMRVVGVLRYPHRDWWEMLPAPARADGTWTGRQVASLLFPPTLHYARGDVRVVDGVLVSGTLTKATLGTSSGGLVDVICRDFGVRITIRFLSDLQRLVNQFLLTRGFNVGIADCVPTARSHTRCTDCVDLALRNVDAIYDHGVTAAQTPKVEQVVQDILSKTLMNVATVVHEEMGADNAIRCMVTAGSKGNMLNLAQICGIVGQQTVEGQRVCADVPRPLPHVPAHTTDVGARGFVRRPYIQGLTPAEHFFHAMGGREGLVDTSCKTATTGYLQRRLVKGMEDNRAENDGTVRNAEKNIVQFVYGADGYDPTKLERFNADPVDWDDNTLRAAVDDGSDVGRAQFARARALRDAVFAQRRVLTPRVDTQVLQPVHVARRCKALRDAGRATTTPIDPARAAAAVDELLGALGGNLELQLLCLVHLSAKQVGDMDEAAVVDLCALVARKHAHARLPAGEAVGCIAAQSIGEPTTQLTLNSVDWNTTMAIHWTGDTPPPAPHDAEVGAFIDALIDERPDDCQVQPDGKTIYLPLAPGTAMALSPDADGNMLWTALEAVTRHPPINKDGSHTLVEVTTDSGRKVTVTKGKSLLVEREGKLVEIDGDKVAVGDRVPVVRQLPAAEHQDTLNLHTVFGEAEVAFTNTVIEAAEAAKHGKDWCGFKDRSCYNSNLLQRAIGRPALLEPDKVIRKHCNHFLPMRIPLDRDFGFFVGAYLAEGCVTAHQVHISNVNPGYRAAARVWPDRHGIHSHVTHEKHQRKNNGTSISTMFHSAILVDLMRRTCGKLSAGKRVPGFAFAAPDEFVRGLLDAYISGDGSISKKQSYMYACSRSQKLRDGIALLMTRFGIGCRLTEGLVHSHVKWATAEDGTRTQTRHGEKTPVYYLCISSEGTRRFAERVDLVVAHKQERCDEILASERVKQRKAFGDRLKDVRLEEIVALHDVESSHEFVYDLTVAGTRNMTAVHGLGLSDTFHSAGIGNELCTFGVPYFKSIIDLSHITGHMRLALRDEYARDADKARRVAHAMIHTRLLDVVASTQLLDEPDPARTDVEHDELMLQLHTLVHGAPSAASRWVARMVLDRQIMQQRHLTPPLLMHKLHAQFGATAHFVCSETNALEWVLRARLRDAAAHKLDLQNEHGRMVQTTVSGLRAITHAQCNEVEVSVAPGVTEMRHVVDTAGVTFTGLVGAPAIDLYAATTNNLHEVHQQFGIEACTATLFHEVRRTITADGTHVDWRHCAQVADTMTFRGDLTSFTRHGINRVNQGPLLRASFEETLDIMSDAAMFNETDAGCGVTQSVAFGQTARIGTGLCEVRADTARAARHDAPARCHPSMLRKSRVREPAGQVAASGPRAEYLMDKATWQISGSRVPDATEQQQQPAVDAYVPASTFAEAQRAGQHAASPLLDKFTLNLAVVDPVSASYPEARAMVERALGPDAASLELEARVGRADGTGGLEVSLDELHGIDEALRKSPAFESARWEESHCFFFTVAGNQYRTETRFASEAVSIHAVTVQKRRLQSATIACGGHLACRLALSEERVVTDAPEVVLPEYVRLRQRASHTYHGPVCSLRYDLTRTWGGSSRSGVEKKQATEAPRCEVEIELLHTAQSASGTAPPPPDPTKVAEALLVCAMDLPMRMMGGE